MTTKRRLPKQRAPARWAALALLLVHAARAVPVADAGAPPAAAAALPPLPTPAEARMPEASPAAVTRLNGLLARLNQPELAERKAALIELASVGEDWLPAIGVRLEALADGADKAGMKRDLLEIRRLARNRLREEQRARGASTEIETPDYLEMLVVHAPRREAELARLTSVVALSRMLERIGSVPAIKQRIRVYVRFGEFLRVDTELALKRLGARATAALIETTRHPAPSIARWAEAQLVDLGKATPSDAVQSSDAGTLVDVLRAFGRARRLDAMPILVSYAQSERGEIRRAARESIVLLGAAALWPLRDAYEKATGKRTPQDWPWQRAARELFAAYDQKRHGEAYSAFAEGKAAALRGDLAVARVAFDRVLAWDPSFHGGRELADVYVRFANANAEQAPAEALDALQRAERLLGTGGLPAEAQSLRDTLDAERLLARGVVDQVLLHRALEADPKNRRARALLDELMHAGERSAAWQRYRIVALIAGFGLIASLIVALRHRRERAAPVEGDSS